jgi:hypothetical protein
MKINDGNKALAVLIVLAGVGANDLLPLLVRGIASLGSLIILLSIVQAKKPE